MQKQDKETDLAIKRLFHAYLESVEENPVGEILIPTMSNKISNRVQTIGKLWTAGQIKKWCEWLDNEAPGKKTDPVQLLELLFFIEKVLGLTITHMISNRVQTMGKQWTAEQIKKWCEWMDNEAQKQGKETDSEALPLILSFIENCEKEGEKKTS